MQITKAVITAAGRGARQYPASDTVQKAMLPLVDRDGLTKPVLQIIAEEAFESGIEEICVVSAPGDEAYYRHHFRSYAANLRQAFHGVSWAEEQAKRLTRTRRTPPLRRPARPRRLRPRRLVRSTLRRPVALPAPAGRPPLHLLRTTAGAPGSCSTCAREQACAVSAVQSTREHLIHQYGTVTGKRLPDRPEVYLIDEIIEKPTLTQAELKLQVQGLRAGHYLCFFGMHVLTPALFEILDKMVRADSRDHGQIQLTSALNTLAANEKYLALETRGNRHNLGVKFGFVEAQIALALSGADREAMLRMLLESVARLEPTASHFRPVPDASNHHYP